MGSGVICIIITRHLIRLGNVEDLVRQDAGKLATDIWLKEL